MEEPPSPLLKSRIPRKTIIVDHKFFPHEKEYRIYDLHCPLRKAIIYYRRDDAIFEHNIHSSRKHEPRIIVPKHSSRRLDKISFIPIKGNRILLIAKYLEKTTFTSYLHLSNHEIHSVGSYLHLSIHEICSDNRAGPVLWSFNGSVDDHFNILDLEPIKSTENALGITIGARFEDHWKLFDISTTETDTLNNFPLTESGRLDFDLKLKSNDHYLVILSPDRHILLSVDFEEGRYNETIDIHYSDSGGTNFTFVARMSIPTLVPKVFLIHAPELAFSADGFKFAIAMGHGRVYVWDIRSKVPLKTFMEVSKSNYDNHPVRYLQFSSGNVGKKVLVFVERDDFSGLEIIHVIDATSFETEETLLLKSKELEKYGRHIGVHSLFFDPIGVTLYAELNGTLYEWDLQKNKHGPEWWIGE